MNLDLLVLGDMHYVGPEGTARPLPARKGKFALELAVRVVRNALRAGRPDAIVLVGDIVERGSAPGAMEDAKQVRDSLSAFGIPLIVVPGNHDDYPDRIQDIFDCPEGVHEINGHLLVTFSDRYDPGTEVPLRSAESLKRLDDLSGSGKPIITIQHPVVLPKIECNYPFNLVNSVEVAQAYAKRGVCLSISGHFHDGVEAFESEGVTYLVAPVLCEAPFSYTRIRMKAGQVDSTETKSLHLEDLPGLFDAHMHTQFAHCADDTNVTAALARMDLLGLRCSGFAEHADHLYLPRDGFWGRLDTDQRPVLAAGERAGHSRYREYERIVHPIRSDRIFLGLEAEPAADGKGLALLKKDAKGYDYILGAIHQFGDKRFTHLPDEEIDARFLQKTRQVVEAGVDVLAHPFRYFKKTHNRVAPKTLYAPVADLLAEAGVAAEINYHTNEPDPEFFAICLKRGVKLSFGSDAHALFEVADLHPHLQLIDELGAAGRLEEILWRPKRARGADL